MPLVQIGEPADWRPVDQAIANLHRYQWLVFTSANGVHAFVRRMRQQGEDLAARDRLRLAAIGPGTAEVLSRYGVEADVIPQQFRSEELARALKERVAGSRVLLARADRGRDILREELANVAAVEQIAVYSQTDIADVDTQALGLLRRGEVDYVTVTSSSIARALARVLDDSCRRHVEAGRVKLVSISPVTSAVLKEEDLPVAREATAYTMAGMVQALLALAREAVG